MIPQPQEPADLDPAGPRADDGASPDPQEVGLATDLGLTTERELRRMALIHRRDVLASRRPARAVTTTRR